MSPTDHTGYRRPVAFHSVVGMTLSSGRDLHLICDINLTSPRAQVRIRMEQQFEGVEIVIFDDVLYASNFGRKVEEAKLSDEVLQELRATDDILHPGSPRDWAAVLQQLSGGHDFTYHPSTEVISGNVLHHWHARVTGRQQIELIRMVNPAVTAYLRFVGFIPQALQEEQLSDEVIVDLWTDMHDGFPYRLLFSQADDIEHQVFSIDNVPLYEVVPISPPM